MQRQPANNDASRQRTELIGLVRRVERRIRLQRAIERSTSGGLGYLMVMAVVVVLYKTGWIALSALTTAATGFLAVPVVLALWGWFRRVDRIAVAQMIDQTHGLHDRLSTALSLLEEGRDDHFVRAQIRDALRHADQIDSSRAAPFKRPTDLAPVALFAAAVALIAFLEPPSHVHPLPEPPHIQHDPVLDSATVAIERERLEQMKTALDEIDDPAAEELVDEIEDLLDKVENREISEKEFLDRIDEIEEEYFDQQREDAAQELADKLKEAAEELEAEAGEQLAEHEELAETVEALKEKDLKKAAKSLDKLAEKLKDGDLSDEQAEKLSDLIEKFADKIDPEDSELRELAEKHKELVDKLSEKLDMQGSLTDSEKQRLEREKEKLDRVQSQLDRNAQKESSRQLKRLQRAAEDMADKLDKDKQQGQQEGQEGQKGQEQAQRGEQGEQGERGEQQQGEQGQDGQEGSSQQEAGRSAEKAAEDLDKGGDQQGGDEVRRMARRQLDEMRESMRRSSGSQRGERSGERADKQRGEDMRDFLRRARGEEGEKEGEGGSEGQQGAQQGQAQSEGSGEKGKEGSSDGGDQEGGSGAGQGDGDKRLGEETTMDSTRKDSRVQGRHADGESKSQIIKAASEKGFATTEYKDVYVDYEAVVEEVMEREEVPAGYRYYIKRYFELIKPRQ